ncbi:MAG: deoxyribodipyrimidine photo-lyase, partial [Gemmataceae bacterium]
MKKRLAVIWVKRDARLADNACFAEADKLGLEVLPFFCFEPSVLAATDTSDMHIHAQWQALKGLRQALRKIKADIVIAHGEIIGKLTKLHDQVPFSHLFAHEEIGNNITFQRDKAVAKWWSRDKNGNMNDSLVNYRGENTATDTEVKTDQASENSRTANLGYELLKKSYIAVYEISNLRTMTEVYDAMDAARKKTAEKTKKPFTPVERKEEGWYIDYNMYVLKLDWTDSLQQMFWNDFWVDSNTKDKRSERIKNFDKNIFPLEFVTTVSGLVISTQSNNPDDYGPLKGKRLSMEELLV